MRRAAAAAATAAAAAAADAPVRDDSRDDALARAAEQIKAVEEPAVRVFLRLRLAKHLWSKRSAAASRAAEEIAAEAVGDLQARHGEIPKLYAGAFRRELLAALRSNAPALAERLIKLHDLDDNASRVDTAFELLSTQGGAAEAVELMRRSLRAVPYSFDPRFAFLFARLDEVRPAETDALLADLMNALERAPEAHPPSALSALAHSYLFRAATPPQLKARFLAALVRATRDPAALPDAERAPAHNLLKLGMAEIERLLPALYPQAGAQAAALSTLIAEPAAGDAERASAEDNIRRSADRVEQLIEEAARARDAAYRRELLRRAARQALSEGRLRLAAGLCGRSAEGGDGASAERRDELLGDVARKALEKRDLDAFGHAAALIGDPLLRASAVQRLALHHHAGGDTPRAREALDDALKLAARAPEGAAKVTTLLAAVAASLKVDELRATEIAQSAVKALNGVPADGAAGGESRHRQVETALQIAYPLLPVFERLAQRDEAAAGALAGKIHRAELRAAALLGAAVGLDKAAAERASGAGSH